MNKKNRKVLIIGAISMIAGISGYFIYKNSLDEDWSIVESIQNFGKDVKNEPKGCCPPHDGQLTQTECDQSGGFNWFEGECPGFAVELSGDSTTELSGGGSGYTKYHFDMYTCSDSIYSTWQGTWDLYWTWITSDEEEVDESLTNQDLEVIISPSGIGDFEIFWGEIGSRTVIFMTDGSNMSFELEQKNLDPSSGSGKIIKGAGRCAAEEKNL